MNRETFNQQDYRYEVVLSDSKRKCFPLNSSVILNLTIEDTIFSPFATGSIVINNVKDILQSAPSPDLAMHFAGNNHDLLIIDIMPNVSGDLEADCNNEEIKKIFNLQFVFCLNELQDPDEGANSLNIMNFRDSYQQFLIENSATVSSADVAAKNNPDVPLRDMTNSERSARTGDLMKEIIMKTFNVDDEATIIDSKRFDVGKVFINWTSTGDASGLQNLLHVAKMHLSEEHEDPCILKLDRYTRRFTNLAFSKLFELQRVEPKKYVLETLLIDSGQTGKRASVAGKGMQGAGYIVDYKLSMVGGNEFSRKITNSIYNTTAGADRNFYMSSSKSSIEAALKDYTKLYVESLQNVEKSMEPAVDAEHFIKANTLRPRIVNEVTPIDHEARVRNNMLTNMIVNNSYGIVLRVLGSTHRRSGTFIDIDTTSQIGDTKFNEQVLGRWFVTSVQHVFMGNTYYNIIEAIKTYTRST